LIKNVIFDLGNVLVDVHYDEFREKIYNNNVSKEAYDNFFLDGNYRLIGYEAGMISTDEFISRCINGLQLNMTRDEFIESFNNMFTEITPMKEFVTALSEERKYSLFLLSNTSPLHWQYAKRKFDFLNLFDKFGLSYELKSLKPEKEIYEKAIKHFGVNAEECLFIDDLSENCIAAEKLGIKTIVYDKSYHSGFEKIFHEKCGF